MAVNLSVDFAAGRFAGDALLRAHAMAAAGGYRLEHAADAGDRLAAWIDWQFGPSSWSAEALQSDVWIACDAAGEIAGFAAFDLRTRDFFWLRSYRDRPDVGIFGPFGVAEPHRKTGVGEALLTAALASLRAKGYAQALIPAVGYDALIEMYRARAGAVVADTYSLALPRRHRATILASGSGTNAQHVFAGIAAGLLPLEIGAVIANAPGARVIERAAAAGIVADVIVWDRRNESRAAFDARVIAAVAGSQPDLVLLLGWMHLLPPAFIERFAEILNVHPAFLPFDTRADDVVLPDGSVMPAFRGAHALRDALEAGWAWTGASVHRVTTEVDRGAIVVRTPLHLGPDRDVATVAATLRPIEHSAVAAAIRRWSFERAGLVGPR